MRRRKSKRFGEDQNCAVTQRNMLQLQWDSTIWKITENIGRTNYFRAILINLFTHVFQRFYNCPHLKQSARFNILKAYNHLFFNRSGLRYKHACFRPQSCSAAAKGLEEARAAGFLRYDRFFGPSGSFQSQTGTSESVAGPKSRPREKAMHVAVDFSFTTVLWNGKGEKVRVENCRYCNKHLWQQWQK